MRLISKDRLLNDLMKYSERSRMPDYWHEGIADAIGLIDQEKVIDAEPVRHGTNICSGWFVCSECGFVDGFHGYEPRYCPNCGAKMDEEAEDDETD